MLDEDDVLLRIAEVEQRAGLSRSTIYKRIAEGTFPSPRQLGGGVVRWPRSEIRRWQQGLPVANAPVAEPPPPANDVQLALAPAPGPRRRGRPRLAAGA